MQTFIQAALEERLTKARARVNQVIQYLVLYTDFSEAELRTFTEAELRFYRLAVLAEARAELKEALETVLVMQGAYARIDSAPDTLRSSQPAIAQTAHAA